MMTLEEFNKKYGPAAFDSPAQFMRVSVVSWVEYIRKLSDGKFAPDMDYLLRFSDADNDYEFSYNAEHTKVNRDVTICELLRIADLIFYHSYSENDKARKTQMQQDASYIVSALLLRPFAILRDPKIQEAMPQRLEPDPPAMFAASDGKLSHDEEYEETEDDYCLLECNYEPGDDYDDDYDDYDEEVRAERERRLIDQYIDEYGLGNGSYDEDPDQNEDEKAPEVSNHALHSCHSGNNS